MRKLLIAASVLAGLSVGAVASAANSDTMASQAKAYVNLGFGGNNSSLPSNFHYGLRLDHDSRMAARLGREALPAIMQVEFNAKNGFSSAKVNGVPFANRVTRFDEDGGSTTYSVMDWGLLAIGTVGLGFGIAEVLKTKDDSDPGTSTGTTTGTTGGGGLLGTGLLGGTDTTGAGGLLGTGLLGFAGGAYADSVDAERQAWLDGGTGHMGDLNTAR